MKGDFSEWQLSNVTLYVYLLFPVHVHLPMLSINLIILHIVKFMINSLMQIAILWKHYFASDIIAVFLSLQPAGEKVTQVKIHHFAKVS